jgi:hypothetical protein
MTTSPSFVRLHCRDDRPEWEQIVFAEVLIPDVPNVFGDFWTKEAIKDAAYAFMREGFGIDVNHDNVDGAGVDFYVAETFIARPGDPDFIEGSWVVGMKIISADIWEKILNNELNGYSYEALVAFLYGTLRIEDDGVRTGYTEPHVEDGHTHAFMVLVDTTNRPLQGGTDEVNGHSHTISTHTVTDVADGHSHRYNIVSGVNGQ